MVNCLVVEDSETVRQITQELVEQAGAKSCSAGDAAEGLAVLEEQRPDIVFLDWDLPSMGALDFLKGLSAFEKSERPAVILCAVENSDEQFTLARAIGARYHIIKPYDGRDIAEILSVIARERDMVASSRKAV